MKPYTLALSTALLCLLTGCLTGCVSAPQNRDLDHLFNDKLFAPPTTKVNADDVFAVSNEMRHYLKVQIADQLRNKGPQQGLIDALSSKNQLKVEYDAAETQTETKTLGAVALRNARRKKVIDYMGSDVGMPGSVSELEDEIDRVAGVGVQ